jgi:hypothetical protein
VWTKFCLVGLSQLLILKVLADIANCEPLKEAVPNVRAVRLQCSDTGWATRGKLVCIRLREGQG